MYGQRKPGITVLLPLHGEAPFLAEALASTLSQQCQHDLEVLVVLDRAGPSAMAVLQGINDRRVRTMKAHDVGLVAALNTGVSAATHEFIARMDADDRMLPNRLLRQAAFLDANPRIACVGGQFQVIDATGAEIGRRTYATSPIAALLQSVVRNPLGHPGVMFRAAAVETAGLYRTRFDGAEDYDLWLRVLDRAGIANLPDDVLQYRVHGSQVTANRRKVADSTLLVQWRALARLPRTYRSVAISCLRLLLISANLGLWAFRAR